MATEVKAFRAEDGTLHNTACEAAVRDLNLIINKSPCAENSPYAKIMLEWMTDQAPEIVATLNEYIAACPKPEPTAATPSVEAASAEVAARKAAAIGTMQEMAQGRDREAVKDWLRRYGFDNLADFNARAGFDDVTNWDRFVAEREDVIAQHAPAPGELEGTD